MREKTCLGVRDEEERIEVGVASLMLGKEDDHEREARPSLLEKGRERDKGGIGDMQEAISSSFQF